MTKIAAVIPIGDINKFGYANVFYICLQSVAEFADEVFLVQSFPSLIKIPYRNVTLISNPETWFDHEIFDPYQINRNMDYVYQYVKDFDVTIYLASNYYIPVASRSGLKERCKKVITWDYYYRGNQLADKITSATRRVPMIVNNLSGYRCEFVNDRVVRNLDYIVSDRGDYSEFDSEMVIDAPFEITLNDLQDKMNFFRCYADLLPKRNKVFDWNYWHPYFLDKMKNWRLIDYPLDVFGSCIAEQTQPDYLAELFMKELFRETA